MEETEIVKVAAKFGVRAKIETDGDYVGFMTLYGPGETVECSIFDLKHGKVRLRKRSFPPIDGDFAVAIAVALTRSYSGAYYNWGGLLDTIRAQVIPSPTNY